MTRRSILFWLVAVAVLAGGAWWWSQRTDPGAAKLETRYRFATLDRGEIVQAVTANGTLNPVILVNVGTQISGTIKTLGTDFNEPVKRGQVLARLDPALIEAAIAQIEANIAQLQAAVGQAAANLANVRTQQSLARTRLSRNRELLARNFISQSQVDDSEQALQSADAQVTAAEAALRAVQAQVGAAQAQLQRERTNLGYTVIRSPIDGVVVARSVDVGQTVAASFQTPTLFQIARDLREMQIDTSIAEADIALIKVGMPVSFRVDALVDQNFAGTVRQIRLNPAIQSSVVTYNVVIDAPNPAGRLLPGMTASVRIEIERKASVLRIPNTALRFRPTREEDIAPLKTGADGAPGGAGTGAAAGAAAGGAPGAGGAGPGAGGPGAGGPGAGGPGAAGGRPGGPPRPGGRRPIAFVPTLVDGEPKLERAAMRLGITDGTFTEVIASRTLKEGDRVAIGEIATSTPPGGAARGFQLRGF